MKKYILKRVGISIVTVFVLVSVVFFLARLMPGGPFNDPKMSATAKANLSAYYGFDKPLLQQYLTYLNNLIHGNFGFSTKYPSRTVNDLLAGAFPRRTIWQNTSRISSQIISIIWMFMRCRKL